MAKLTTELKQAIAKAELYPLATASKTGMPNVIPIKFVFVADDDTLWLTDNFMNKTMKNLRQNPQAALNVDIPSDNIYIQIKGTTEIESIGENYEAMRKKVLAVKPDAPANSLVIMKITEIYQCLPGDTLGQRLDK
jgi:predicted pyridoxine 5'-phosphate oxidase superfamily flavin-nucleotide-binding protein